MTYTLTDIDGNDFTVYDVTVASAFCNLPLWMQMDLAAAVIEDVNAEYRGRALNDGEWRATWSAEQLRKYAHEWGAEYRAHKQVQELLADMMEVWVDEMPDQLARRLHGLGWRKVESDDQR